MTSDPRGGEREENIVNFPCRFECSIPFRLFLFEERGERPPFSSFFQAWLSPPSFLCRFRMPIKLTSCLVNDRIPGQIEFRLNTCAKWQEELPKTKRSLFGLRIRSMRIGLLILLTRTRYNLTDLTGNGICFFICDHWILVEF